MLQGIGLECVRVRLNGQALLDPRYDLLLDDLDQPWIDHLVDDKEGLPIHGVDVG